MNAWKKIDPAEFEKLVVTEAAALLAQGFALTAEGCEIKPTYVSISLVGVNWIVTFTCDNRDELVDTYVRDKNAPASHDRALLKFLMETCGFRGRLGGGGSDANRTANIPEQTVRDCVAAIKAYAPKVWNDEPVEHS